jgi:glutathione S-transferase
LKNHPVLYSFRRCPYAMRARLAIDAAQLCVELREVELRNKPESLLLASPKATVPVLVQANVRVIDESLDIMQWALAQHDPEAWLANGPSAQTQFLLDWNDTDFKYYLDRYKYADRYPEFSELDYRQQGERFLMELEQRLTRQPYLLGEGFTWLDAAILPFIRQFEAVDEAWFQQSPYPAVQRWLHQFLSSARFRRVMNKYSPWKPGDAPVWFGESGQQDPN